MDSYERYQRDSATFYADLEKQTQKVDSATQKLEDQNVQVEFVKQVLESGVLPLLDLATHYQKLTKTFQRVLRMDETEARKMAREMIVRSVELTLTNSK